MFKAYFEGSVMEVYSKTQEGKEPIAMFKLYQRGCKELLEVEGNGVKEGETFKGTLEVALRAGSSAKGKSYAFMTFKKVIPSLAGVHVPLPSGTK